MPSSKMRIARVSVPRWASYDFHSTLINDGIQFRQLTRIVGGKDTIFELTVDVKTLMNLQENHCFFIDSCRAYDEQEVKQTVE